MKLLFVDCQPSAPLRQALDHHKLVYEQGDLVKGGAEAQIVIWRIAAAPSLSQLPDWRRKLPHAWIVVIVPDAWLSDPGVYSSLLSATDKDDVWLESAWETGFWIGIQRAVQNRASRNRELRMQQELDAIKAEQEKLVASSTALVENLENDARLANEVHRKFYPRFSPDVPGVHVLSKYLPASGKGGDYFDLFEFSDKRRFGILLADSNSHKTAASLLSALLKVRLDDLRTRFPGSTAFVDHLHTAVASEQPNGSPGMKLLYGVFDRATLSLELTVAGGVYTRLWRKGKWESLALNPNPTFLEAPGHVWKNTQIDLQAGDTLLLCSDGVLHAFDNQGGIEPTLQSLAAKTDALDIRNHLLAQIDSLRVNHPLEDDLTFILLSIDSRATFMRAVK